MEDSKLLDERASSPGAGDEASEKSATTTADEDLVDLVQKWDVEKRRLVLVVAGKAGVGKSTVINNLLGLKGEKAAKAKRGARSVTTNVEYYEEKVHGITVRIIDTPGLEAIDLNSKKEQEQRCHSSLMKKLTYCSTAFL